MSTLIAAIAQRVAAEGLTLRKASPRGPDHLVLELLAEGGEVLGGQWHRDPGVRDEIAERTDRACGRGSTVRLPGSGLLLQPGGADRRLPALRGLVSRPGARLVAHRPERRAVVHDPAGHYTKVVRPGRTAEVARGLRVAGATAPPVPRVLEVEEDAGTVTLAALPGRTLHDRLLDPTLPDTDLVRDAHAAGRALAGLHRCEVSQDRPVHTTEAELAAARRWLEPAVLFAGLSSDRWQPTYRRAAMLLSQPPGPAVLVHRDLHDKQLVVDRDGSIGMLDLDLATGGEAALDLANLLVHLRLRHLQGLCTPDRSRASREALLAGYGPDPQVLGRVTAYAAATWLRLAGVYSLRAAPPPLVDALLEAAAGTVASAELAQTSSRNRSSTRAPNSSASTGTRSSTPWNSAPKSRSRGSRSGAKP